MKKNFILVSILVVLVAIGISSGLFGGWDTLSQRLPRLEIPKTENQFLPGQEKVKIVTEESVVIDVVKKVGPSVVTIGMEKQQVSQPFEINPFDPFGILRPQQPQLQEKKIEQDIGSGFIISSDGMIVTNKHVVSDTTGKYKVVTSDEKVYQVQKIYRDTANDLAILKIDASNLKPVELGDSSKLEVGQFVIAIGTALGEFRNTVTTGVVSGLGRGITAGSPFEGAAERLDDVIQTDAAINPGNSGGPLLNSAGQVVGINVAVAAEGQNIGFALPINLIKDSLVNFEQTGKFSRAYLGVSYKMISRNTALLNDVPEGAYVVEVTQDSPADKSGIKEKDIITKIDGKNIRENEGDLAQIISKKKVGDRVELTSWRNGVESKLSVTLGEAP